MRKYHNQPSLLTPNDIKLRRTISRRIQDQPNFTT